MCEGTSGACRFCGQTKIISREDKLVYPGIEDADELAALTCVCEDGRTYREAKRQEVNNLEFINFVEHDLKDYMDDNDLKAISVQDDNGNRGSLLRLEKGNVKIVTTLKKVVG